MLEKSLLIEFIELVVGESPMSGVRIADSWLLSNGD